MADQTKQDLLAQFKALTVELVAAAVQGGVNPLAYHDFLLRGWKASETWLTVGEVGTFLKELKWDAPHLFAGADTGTSPSADQQGEKVVDGSDPLAFGQNVEGIATGKVLVR